MLDIKSMFLPQEGGPFLFYMIYFEETGHLQIQKRKAEDIDLVVEELKQLKYEYTTSHGMPRFFKAQFNHT